MNREIKFRVWDNVDYMAYFTLHDYIRHILSFTEDCHVMQFTGLKDKNGKEIYEGDIIQYTHEYRVRTWNNPGETKSLTNATPQITIGKDAVKYAQGEYLIGNYIPLHRLPEFTESNEGFHGEWSDNYRDFEVIGNIYQTPELIKV